MCGIAGIFSPGGLPVDGKVTLQRMTDALARRGPDDQGHWHDGESGVALGHRRLSVVDLSPAGHQPIHSACGRWIMVYNGEIYNHRELRSALERASMAPDWRGHSDSEVLLAAMAAWGVEAALQRCVGMFAIALWDRHARTLTLARDRLGEKPLYYGVAEGRLVFASELAALLVAWPRRPEIDRDALTAMMRYGYVPGPRTIYRDIFKLPQAHVLVFDTGLAVRSSSCFWDLGQIAAKAAAAPFSGSAEDAVGETERLLAQSLAGQMLADVPVGAFLSGGIDSSTVVAVMQSISTQPVHTFSIGFDEKQYNEADYAKAIARHLGTDHTELYVSPRDAMDVIPRLPSLYSEPFADSSQIPTFLVSQLARRRVTVSLSGDGGDELFSGYTRYGLSDRLWRNMARVPGAIRRATAAAILGVSPQRWNQLLALPLRCAPQGFARQNVGDRLHKVAGVLTLPDRRALYRRLVSSWDSPHKLVLGGQEPPSVLTGGDLPALPTAVQEMMYLDLVTYLPDDILVKLDRASMAVSLESRVPLLDHRIVEFALSLPLSVLRRGGQSKWPLRQVLYRHVPPALVDRPKMGFGIPLDSWLRGPLRDWAEALLDEGRLAREGFFDVAMVRKAWKAHLAQERNNQYSLWNVLMFQAWLEVAQSARVPTT